MRLWPKHWHAETWVCSLRHHCIPAATVRSIRPEDHRLAVETGDGRRLSRCLRCDCWIEGPLPAGAEITAETLPALADMRKPRRAKVLEEAILLRLIAIDRGVHAVIFGLLAIGLGLLQTRLGGLHDLVQGWVSRLQEPMNQTRPTNGDDWLSRQLAHVLNVKGDTIKILFVTAVAYAAIEGIEAVGLWRERRWAEYLTVIATAGFLPFEIEELAKRVTALRLGALVINVALLIWLLYSKRLFGLRGGFAAMHEGTDWVHILENPTPNRPRRVVLAAADRPGPAEARVGAEAQVGAEVQVGAEMQVGAEAQVGAQAQVGPH